MLINSSTVDMMIYDIFPVLELGRTEYSSSLCFSFLCWVITPPTPRKPVIFVAFPWLGRAATRHEIATSFNVLVCLTLVLSHMMQHGCHPSFSPPSVIWERMKKWRFHRHIWENSENSETSPHTKLFNFFSYQMYIG